MFKLLMLDVDGVMTDGTKTYDIEGNVCSKSFCDRDFTAIKRFKESGIDVWWLSGDTVVNKAIAEKRDIHFLHSVNYNKPVLIRALAKGLPIDIQDIAYVGDDWYDLATLKLIGYPFCTCVAPKIVQNCCKIIPRQGGDGVVAYLYDNYMEKLI